MDKYTYNVHAKNHMRRGRLKTYQMRALTKFNLKKDFLKEAKSKNSQMSTLVKFNRKNTYDDPSSWKHPKNITSISPDQSPHMNMKVLRMFKYRRKVHMIKKVLEMFKYKWKEPQNKRKTSSSLDTYQDEDLAVPEGLNPRVGITGYPALPVSLIARQPSQVEL